MVNTKEKTIMDLFNMLRISGCSVTQRIKQVKQPRGGFLPQKNMEAIQLNNNISDLYISENIAPALIGLTVDYLTRFMTGTPKKEAFSISLKGASVINQSAKAKMLLWRVKGLDKRSIISAVKLTGFDVCFRSGVNGYRNVNNICPDDMTISNIQTMVYRSIEFLRIYGPKVLDGFTFQGGYTKTVRSGDGDFLTNDTLWDFKVSKTKPNKDHTLQLLMYWRMGLHSVHPEFREVKYLGIYNPRLNTVYRINVEKISKDVIDKIETEVIGY